MPSEPLFIWNYLPGQVQPVVAGRLDVHTTPSGTVGSFVYGQSYLERSDSVSLDPVVLPLNAAVKEFTTLSGFPGVVLDACPDRWGIKVIDRLMGQQVYPLGYLLMNDPGRAGSLGFSLSATEAPIEMTSREFPLADLLDAAHAVESDRPVDPELLKALHPGTGGARPKCNVRTDGAVWIAKFPSLHDEASISIPRLEHATLQLAAACGLQAASSRLLQINGQDVCLVRRFDRILAENEQVHRQAYVSARTVFFADPGYANMATGSYGRLARWMTRYGCVAEQRKELYRRMVFNVAVRNSDDHELNHGLVQIGGQFQLADAFDLLPTLTPHRVHRHALLIGDSAAGTVNNLLSNATAFGLSVDEAKGVIADLQAMIQDKWQDTLYAAGFGDDEIRRLEPYFAPIPWSS